jgi:hypothetical protein
MDALRPLYPYARIRSFDLLPNSFESAMRTPLSALLLLLLPALALGQVQNFRKEAKQVMGSARSQDDARAAAITRAKRDALGAGTERALTR